MNNNNNNRIINSSSKFNFSLTMLIINLRNKIMTNSYINLKINKMIMVKKKVLFN